MTGQSKAEAEKDAVQNNAEVDGFKTGSAQAPFGFVPNLAPVRNRLGLCDK